MGFDLAAAFIGDLFFGGAADAAAAGAADVGLGAAEGFGSEVAASAAAPEIGQLAAEGGVAADTGLGLGAAAGAGSEVAASAAAPEIGQLAAEGGVAADVAPTAADTLAGAGSLGETVGQGADTALALADTAAPQTGAVDSSLSGFLSDPGAATSGITPSATTAPTTAGAPSVAANVTGGTVAPSTELAGDNPELAAALDKAPVATTPGAQGTQAMAFADNPAPAADTAPAGFADEAGGGVSPATNAALANAPATPAGAAAAPAAPAAGGGITDTLSGALNSPWLKAAELGIPAALLAKTYLGGAPPIPPQANLAVQNAATQLAPLQGQASQNVPLYNATAAQNLNQANQNKVSPQWQALEDTKTQGLKNQLYQQVANQQPGGDPRQSSEYIQGVQQIDQQAMADQVAQINSMVQTAFQSASAANAGVSTSSGVTSALDNTLMQAAQLQVAQDTNFQNALGNATKTLTAGTVLMSGGNAAKTAATATALS